MDALDTLYIMGLHEEFKDGQEWIEQNLDFGVVRLSLLSIQNRKPSSIICPLSPSIDLFCLLTHSLSHQPPLLVFTLADSVFALFCCLLLF